jgi:CRP-like cAMP-binding protein
MLCPPLTVRVVPHETSKDLLRKIHIFAGLTDEVIDELAALCQPVHAAPGHAIIDEKVMGREMYVIAAGRVRIVRGAGSPEQVVLAELSAGDFFGEMCVIECVPRSASVHAEDESLLYSLSSSDIHRLFKRWPDQCAILLLNIARDLCRRLRMMDEKFAAVAH